MMIYLNSPLPLISLLLFVFPLLIMIIIKMMILLIVLSWRMRRT